LAVTTPLPPQTLASGATKSTTPAHSAMQNGQTPACAAPRGKDWGRLSLNLKQYQYLIWMEWRRRRDSNPRDGSPSAPLAGVCLRPLGHISACASSREAGGKTRRKSRKEPDCSMGMRRQGLGRSRAAGAAVCDPAGDRNASTRRNVSYRCGGLEARMITRIHVLNLFPDI
jgi:hypothetical protein